MFASAQTLAPPPLIDPQALLAVPGVRAGRRTIGVLFVVFVTALAVRLALIGEITRTLHIRGTGPASALGSLGVRRGVCVLRRVLMPMWAVRLASIVVRTALDFIHDVLATRTEPEIDETRIGWVAVEVPYFVTIGGDSNEGQHDETVHVDRELQPFALQTNLRVAADGMGLELPARAERSHVAKVADFIRPSESHFRGTMPCA